MSNAAESESPSYEELAAVHAATLDQLTRTEQEKELYRHRYEELRRKLFGRSSEQRHVIDPGQESLFEAVEPPSSVPEENYTEVPSHQRQKRRKKVFPEDLPIDEVIYEPTETHCEECGEELEEFSRDIREEIEYNPASFYRRQHVTVHCSCPKCKATVSGEVPPENHPVIPGSQVGPSFLSHVMVSKHCDYIPYYRQSQMYERSGVFFPDKTLSLYGMRVGELCQPVARYIKQVVLSLDYLQADETRLRVLDHDKEANAHTGQLWVMRSVSRENPIVVYEYHQGRGKEDAKEFLGNFSGALQTDALASYDDFAGTRLGCMTHARRKFVAAKKISEKESAHVLKLIGQLYKIEADLKKEYPKKPKEKKIIEWLKKREKIRKEKSLPVLHKIREYLHFLKTKCLLETHPLTQAVSYMLSRFEQFCVYTTDGRYEIDNNPVEQAIRPVAIGRKNWMFAGSHKGAEMTAVMMTVIQTCKLRGINPHHYLTNILPRLASQKTTSLTGLTPLDWKM
ncbi:MAG: IS66 family transposase [Bdellovibrionales bacterium]|nr:IS66 family transposase [Bdellovibrionales bacterium]